MYDESKYDISQMAPEAEVDSAEAAEGSMTEAMNQVDYDVYTPDPEGVQTFEDLREFVMEFVDQATFLMLEGWTFEKVGRNPKFWKKVKSVRNGVEEEA